jgi:hypothetical protein
MPDEEKQKMTQSSPVKFYCQSLRKELADILKTLRLTLLTPQNTVFGTSQLSIKLNTSK